MSNSANASPSAFLPGSKNDSVYLKGQQVASSESKRKFNLNTPSFQPSVLGITSKFAGLSPKLKDIPTFVPSGLETANSGASGDVTPSYGSRKFNVSTPSFTPANPYESFNANSNAPDYSIDGFHAHDVATPTGNDQLLMSQLNQASTPKLQQNPYLSGSGTPGSAPVVHSSNAASAFMFHGQGTPNYPLNYHLYSPAPPPRLSGSLNPYETNVNNLFIPNELRETITKRNEAALQTLTHLSLPDHVGNYHSLVPIDTNFDLVSKVYGKPAPVYKVNSNVNGLTYTLRRIELGSLAQIMSELAFSTVKKWKRLSNPNVVRVKEAFTSVAFDAQEPSLCLVYDYYPLSNTLKEQYITRKLGMKQEHITEELLWTYLVQIVGALLAIHKEGLSAGSSLSSSKVIVTTKNRVRLAGVCVDDILDYQETDNLERSNGKMKTMLELQRNDVFQLGALMAELTATTLPMQMRGEYSEQLINHLRSASGKTVSDEWIDVLISLNSADSDFNLAEFYSQRLSLRALEVMNGFQDLSDYYENHLLSEVENGRLFRLMAKLSSLIDRPEKEADLGGNAFVLRQFRDFVFHTRDESGKPAVDLSRILVNLNKLDVGVDEKILLVSSEEDTCMIVSYKEVKDILELSFRAVFRGG